MDGRPVPGRGDRLLHSAEVDSPALGTRRSTPSVTGVQRVCPSRGGVLMSVTRNALLALASIAGACAFAAGASAGTFVPGSLVLAPGPSPFAGCTVGGAPGSVLYPNAEEEPWVDVNPTNPQNLIAVWQQDRWSDGGAHGLVTAVSHNGGLTWAETFPHFSTCAGGTPANGGNFDRSSDPRVSFGPDGTA